MGDLKAFDPADFQKAVADKIKGEFAAMIPEDQWRGLVKKHVDDFLNGKGEGTLQGIVVKELTAKLQEQLKTYFTGDDWNFNWNGAKNVAGTKIRELILENVPLIVGALLQDSFQQVVQAMQQRIGSNRGW
jgi:hypothetical protein